MSMIDQTFNESVLRLQGWMQFLERKAAEYQTQMNRVRRSGTPPVEPVVETPAAASAPSPSPEAEDGWE